jgi:hypothetical protein
MRFHLIACLGFAACQPLYGPSADPLHNPPPHPPRPGSTVATVEVPVYIEDCSTDFHRDARTATPKPRIAESLVVAGDTQLDTATRATDPAKPALLVRSIETYSDALRADPYNAAATLKLALAYDKVLRKGCALAMLRRLESLTANPKLASEASRRIDDVVDNKAWFKGYRKDALAAVNH